MRSNALFGLQLLLLTDTCRISKVKSLGAVFQCVVMDLFVVRLILLYAGEFLSSSFFAGSLLIVPLMVP